MSLLRRAVGASTERRSLFNPQAANIPTNGESGFWASESYSMSSELAMRHAAVYACVRLIADTIASLPFDAYVGEPGINLSDAKIVKPRPAILTNPSKYLSGMEWRHQVVVSLLLQGNAYGLIAATDRLGYPTQIELLDPQGVTVKLDDSGRKVYKIKGKTYTDTDIWHCAGPMMPGELHGLSPIAYAARTINAGAEAEKYGLDFFRNGMSPSAVAETEQPVTEEQATVVKNRLRRGAANREPIVLGAGIKLKPWAITPEQSQLLAMDQWNEVKVCQIFGVPPEMIGAAMSGSTVTYANREQRAQDYLNNAINSPLTRVEQAQGRCFPRTTFVKADTKALLKSDLKTRYDAWKVGIDAGIILPDEARQFEDMPPLPVKDDHTQSSRDVYEAIQKIYLGVANDVLTSDEARTLLNRIGADLPVPGPDELKQKPTPAPLMTPPDAPAGAPDQGPQA